MPEVSSKVRVRCLGFAMNPYATVTRVGFHCIRQKSKQAADNFVTVRLSCCGNIWPKRESKRPKKSPKRWSKCCLKQHFRLKKEKVALNSFKNYL